MKSISLSLVLVCLSVLLSACDNDVHNHSKNITGKQLFELHCASCHNSDGNGQFLLGVPSNRDTTLINSYIRDKMLHGSGTDSSMPIFAAMPEKEAIKIVQYLRKLAK